MSGRLADGNRKARRDDRRHFRAVRVVFRCLPCGWLTVTTQLDDGVVPETLGCRNPTGCNNTYATNIGDPRPWPAGHPIAATHEWYQPSTAQLDIHQRRGGDLWEHLREGGLLLRPVPKRRQRP
jgi:hypothetical protein